MLRISQCCGGVESDKAELWYINMYIGTIFDYLQKQNTKAKDVISFLLRNDIINKNIFQLCFDIMKRNAG